MGLGEITDDMVKLFRRPSIAPEEVKRKSRAVIEEQISDLQAKTSSTDRNPDTAARQGGGGALDENTQLEKIMSLQYTINFDVVFACDYTTRTATLSSIDLMKQEIEEQYKNKRSDTELLGDISNTEPQMSVFVELRRKKLVEDVWNKQHQFRVPMAELVEDAAVKWLETAENHLANADAENALSALEKFLFYRPAQSRAYVLKSVAFQQLKDLRMATMAIKMAQELGLAPEEEKTLQLRLASIEFKQAEKLRKEGALEKAIERYQLASEIIDNYEDALVIIIKLRFELGETEVAMRLLDDRIEAQPERLELRVWRTRQLLDQNKLNVCHAHLDSIAQIDPQNEAMLQMRQELTDRARNHEANCIMMMAANHLKDALREIELAIGAEPKRLSLYLVRARIYRRLKLWEDAIVNLEIIRGSGSSELEKEARSLALAIFNDFGVDCIRLGFYKNAIKLFTATIDKVKGHRHVHLNRGDCYLRLGDLERALNDYETALNLSFHESSCRLIRGRISVVYHEFGMRVTQMERYEVADHYFSRALHYQVAALYLIHRARVRIMMGNEFLAKADAIAAYELDPKNEDLVPVLARLFPDDQIPAVDQYKNRFFPAIKDKPDDAKSIENEKKLDGLNAKKQLAKKKEVVSFGELRSALMQNAIPRLPGLKSQVDLAEAAKPGWKKYATGINT